MPFTLLELCAYSLPDCVLEKVLNDYEFPIKSLKNSCCKIIVKSITKRSDSLSSSSSSSEDRSVVTLQSSYTSRSDLSKFLQKIFYNDYDNDDDDADYLQDVCLRCLQFLYNIQCPVDANDDCPITYNKFDITHDCNGVTHIDRMRLYWFWSAVSVEILKFGRLGCLEFLHKTCQQLDRDDSGIGDSIIRSGSIECFEYARSVNLINENITTIVSCIYYDKIHLLRRILQRDTENILDVIKKDNTWDSPVLRLYCKCIKYGSVNGLMLLVEFGIRLDDLTYPWRAELMEYVKTRFVENNLYKKYKHCRSIYENYEASTSSSSSSSSLVALRTRVSPYTIGNCKNNINAINKSPMQRIALRTKCFQLLQRINVDLDVERVKCLEFLQEQYGTDFNVVIRFMRDYMEDFNKTFVPF